MLKILLAKKLNRKLTPDRIFKMKKGISVLLVIFGTILIVRGIFPNKLENLENQIEIIQVPNEVSPDSSSFEIQD